ncbi:hypothetical protein RO3G_13835 [Rhizopus delemar RA 99-880]|uniref:Ricin B lectin domain-containing protein n=1 Tax=Rhizopus delemar (strain RA 99-880 / ATCC MYA-4621 / FGSC 9543 / NRRL 43880) TaxID=246409 RepID=I1CKZ4_RHIO9|nr:hypothetical protein RO3G_13835 [Rhizopus delemar RA 99-880]|eukprot:EIE89124.1 hypothetical protein RO3G_13835 [Rhizopus delemar RA 99-880]
MASFPEGWFLIKNLNNGYVLSIEKSAVGEPVVIASVRNKDIEYQLWQYGEDKRLHNKKTGYVLDIAKGAAKAGSNVVLQNDTNSTDGQTFGISSEGHIHIIKNPSLVLGIKDSFFTRREGQHVHLQLVDKKNFKERKEQRWELVTPSKRHSFVGSVLSGSVDSFKRTISNASLGSAISLIHDDDDDSHLDESAHLDKFPESEFLIKSELTGHFVSIDAASLNGSGSKVCLEPLRKDNYESQLWHYDALTNRLINKGSGLAMSAEDVADEAFVSQSASMTEQDLASQAWAIGPSGTIRLKHKPQFLLGFKKDTWFSLGRDAPANVLVQKADHRVHSYQKFMIALPIFKKKTTEIVSATEQIGVFPEGYFFIKNQKHGLVISVLDTDKLAASVVAAPLDSQNYNRQLWTHKDGFLINKASQFVLDVRGGCITSGSQLCQYKQKTEGYENQQWGLSVEGYIHAKTHQTMVLALDKQVGDKPSVTLANKKTPDHEEQRWNFVLPVFKQKSTTVTEKSVQKSVIHHHYAQYPSGWFFIRSFVDSKSNEAPLVLTAQSSGDALSLVKVSQDEWRYQLWMHWNGVLINFATQLAVDVNTLAVGATLRQELRQASASTQKWSLTTEGYLVHGANVALSLIPERQASGDYKLVLSEQAKPEHRWGLLTPQTKVENGLQVLQSWKTALLTECKKVKGQYVQKIVHRIADWPEETFYISAQDGLGLVPEKLESYATVVVRKLELGHYEPFRWTFRGGYLVHVATGLVLHASDDLVSGSELQIRERLVTDEKTIDPRQRWIVKTDGSIVSETQSNLGFSLLKQGADYHVQLVYISSQSEHYHWGFAHGRYETRYSNVYKKDMTVLTRLERILLTVRLNQATSDKVKVVTRQFGVFPQNWFYVRSKADSSLVLTAPDKKEGSKLTLSKIDYKIFRRQLWHVEDNDCLINLDSNYVIDVAGGALEAGSDIIQWHKKFLKRQRKNQIWGLSVDGHIRSKAHPGLVLGAKGNRAEDGAQVQLQTRGALDLEYQRWSFAIPIFGRPSGLTSVGILEGSHSDVYVNSVDEKSTIETTSSECYERTEKITIVRRWGLFPQGGFFIRSTYGDQHLALTVEKKARTDGQGRTEYEVALRPMNFKEYKWSYWTFEDGHLIHPHTGLALDATPTKGVLLEDGLQSSLFVREKSMSLYQFWSLTASGEVHLKSDQRMVIGVSSANRITVSGAQVGLRQLHLLKSVNDKGQQEVTLKSESWLQWTFSKPVFGTRKTTVVQEASAAIVSAVKGDDSSEQEIESLADETLEVQESEESSDEYSPEVESEDDEESDSEDEEESSSKQDTSALDKLNLVGNLGIATAGATIMAGAATTAKPASTKATEAPVSQVPVSAGVTEARKEQEVVKTGGSVAKKTSQIKREESFHLSYSYVPSGYEKVVRYKPYQKSFFPVDGYFMIKSYLHGYVLDIANNEARDGSYIVLSPIKVTNFASQLWSFRGGRLVNLKGHNLVLDASLNDTVVAGERVGLSTQKTSVGISDQHWEFDYESGVIHLAGKRNLVLSVKELEPATEKTGRIDLFIQEEKSHQKSHFARAEQRWEVLLPALVPADQTKNKTVESKYTIVEGGKVAAISSSLSAVLAFEWLKATFHHKMAHDNQWPSTENFFFVRIGNENAYLCSGSSVNDNVTFAPLGQREDHKRFLWAYVNGYLVNYKYMLRLVFDKSTNKLTLSSNTDTLNQVFSITSQGVLSLKIDSETIYFTTTTTSVGKSEFQLTTCSEAESTSSQYPVQLHIPVFSNHQVEKEANVALSTITTWIHTSQKVITTTTTTTRSYRYGVFPSSTWFFIIANTKSDESLVLAAKNNSNVEGANLVLKKLSFEDYKSQLWTFRDDTLVNYGSKLVIDVHEGAVENALIKLSSESGLGTQKWSLTAEGRIYLDSYSGYTLGIRQSSTLVEETEIVLLQYDESKSAQVITWKFSVPVFGKKPVSSTASMTSAIESNSSSIEEGIMIETLKEIQFKVEEVFAKKPKYTNKPAAPTKTEVVKDKQEDHHDAHDILANVGIVSGAVAAGAAVVGVASKIMDKLDVEDCEKESKATAVPQKKDTKKPSKKEKANTETVIVRRSKHTSAQIVQESHAIVRAWKIVFIQRIHRCTTKAQLIETIEESREELFRRLDEHLRVYTSVEHMVSGSLPQWHVSIEQVKELYRARVFERFLDRLNHEEINSAAELDFDSVVSSATEEVNRHYESVIEEQKKIQTEVATDVQGVTETSNTEVEVHEHILLTVDTIKVKTRYWLIGLYETISIAKKNGSSEEEINNIVENSRKQLSAELSEIKASTVSHIEKSSSALSAKKSSIVNTIEKAISQTETVISKQVSVVGSEKHYEVNEEYWLEVTRTSEERLSSELKVYQTAITQEVSEVQTSQISKSDQAEISVVLDEKMVGVAQETVTTKLIETKTKLTSWFTEVTQQISWVLESSTSNESMKQDTLDIVNAAQIELATRIEEAKLVLRTYYAHLTYLSWAERRRIEYSLDNIKTSLTANIAHFKQSIEKQEVTKEEITRFSEYSFGATVSRVISLDVETIVSKITKVKETTTVVNTVETKKAEDNKIAAITEKKQTEAAQLDTTKVNGSKSQESQKVKVDQKTDISKAQGSQKVNVDQKSQDKIKVDQKTEDKVKVDQTKVTKTEDKSQVTEDKTSSAGGKATLTAIGAAAAAMASAAIYHHHEGKETQEKKQDSGAIVEKPDVTHANVVVGKNTETLHEQKKTTTTTKQEKSETLVAVYNQVDITVQNWLTTLNKRVIECAQKKSDNVQEEIDTIVYESQQELVVAIEKAKRTTTSVIGTSQTSFHDTLTWIRSTIWTQTAEVKRVAYEVASSSETDITVLEKKLASIKDTTLSKVTAAIEKSKSSASAIHLVGHESAATIAAGKKFEGADYSKTSHGEYVEKTKVSVGILIEETRNTIQRTLNNLAISISERRKQGGENVQADVEAIMKKSREEITGYIQRSKTEFEKRITRTHQVTESSNKVEIELVNETNKKVQATLEQIQESVLVQVSKVEEVTITTTSTQVTDVEYSNKLSSACHEAYERIDASLSVSETIIGHHVEVVAESVEHATITTTEESKETKKVSLGVEYGLLVVAETTKSVSTQITQLIERIHHQVTTNKDTAEQDVKTFVTESNVEIDRVFDEAKKKIEYELSMVASHEKVEEEHFLAVIEDLRVSAKKRVSQVHEVAITKKEETKVVSERLLQIAEESRHEISSHFKSFKESVVEKTEKVKESAHQDISVTRPSTAPTTVAHAEQEKDHESKVDLAKKVLAGSAAVAAGTAIAVEVAKKVSAHKEKVEQEEKIKQQTVEVVEDVKVQFNKWISTLTETVITQSKQSQSSQEEISITIEKSKNEFLEVIQKTKTSTVITEQHQQEILSWIEQTVVSQATCIQEIVVSSSTSTVVDIESRLEVLKISTTQEVEKALEKVKDIKSSTIKFVGSTVEQLKQKESALLDVKSELSLVVHDVRTSVVTFFKKFTSSVITRVQQGGDNVSKDVAILVADTRKEVTSYIENVKNTATKKLSALETKSTVSVISVAALSGIATAELISVLKKTEEILVERINNVHSTVWYVKKDQDMTEIVQKITTIETETTTEISEKIDHSHYGFVAGIAEHHQAGHIATTEVEHHDEDHLKASLTIQEVKVTIREWLRAVAEKVSICSQNGQSSEEIESVITQETTRIFEYIDSTVIKISGHLKSEEKIQGLHSTIEKVKSTITKSTTEIKKIGVEFSGKSTGYGGFGQMSSVINEHERIISETLVIYESKTTVQKTQKQQETKRKESQNETKRKGSQSEIKKKVETKTVVTVEYITTTIHTWLEELMVEVSEVAKREHDVTKVTNQINSIINEAKEFITIELDTVSKKVRQSKGDSAAIQELVNIIEWTRGMVLQSTTQIQQIGVNSAVSFSSTGGIDQMRPLISATETQIKVAIERCSKTIKINVECKPAYHEKYQVEKECRKQEREKSDCDKKAKAEKKKAECEKKDKKKKAECAKKEKKKLSDSKKETKAEESESESESDSSSSDNDDSDSDNERKKKAKKEIKKIVASGAVLSVSVIVREWYEQLIVDVSSRAKRGGSHVDSDIETIVKKATLTIVEKLRLLSENAHNNLVDVSTVQQYRNSIEWAKNLVIQSSLQIQSIGINSAISATSKTGGIEQMRPIVVSIQQQIDVETRRYKLISEKEKSAVQKVESKPVSSVEHKKNTEKVSNGKASVVARKEYCGKLETHISEVISESKVVVIAWYSQLIRDVSIRVHQGGNNVKKDVAAIIEQSKSQLDETLKRTQKKFTSSIDVYEEDETFSVIESQIQETLQIVQKTAEKKVTQVQEITVKYQSESEVTERLSTILESSKVEVTETLDTTCKQAISVIKEETVQNESAVTIIETVEHVKSVVASWQTKLSEEIHAISIDETVHDKEEKINALVHEANTEIERVSQEAKSKISENCKSVKKISKSKQTELLTTIDYVHETFSTDVKKVQEVSVEAVKKSETNIKESISSVFESSRSKVDSFLTRTAAVVVGTAAAAVAVHAIDKKKHKEEKAEKKTGSKSEGQFSLTVRENVKAISLWFELFTQRVSSSVRKQEGNVIEHITSVSEHAEQEISEIIAAARTDFVKRLSHENMDKEAYDYAVKHYEESLESARVSILTEVTEVKKVAIEAHKTGKVEVLDVELNKLVKESTERITVAMGSSVSITHKAQSGKNSSASEGSVLHIEVEDDKEIVGEQNVEFERKEESVNVNHEEKAKKEKHDSNLEKVVSGSLAVGATAGAAVSVHEKNKKDQKKSEKQTVEKYESGVAAIEYVQITISEWFKTLVQKVSHASKSGASSEQITVIVQESRTELTQLIEHVKAAGAAHCTSASDEQQFVSKIEWVSSVAQAQAVQIQQIGINASVSKSDLTSQMESLATASFHQIEVTLEQMKTSINFHQKINKISGKKSVKKAEQAAKQKVTTAVDKTKAAYGVVQETRVATVALLVSLSESIVTRIRHGGASVEEDVHKIVETAEKEVTKIFEKSKRSSTEIDEKTRLQVENALTAVHKTVEEQITQIKTITVQSVNSSASDSESVIGKVLEISKNSTQKVETEFTSVSETITTSLTVVSQTAQKTTESVQSWFSELNEKIMKLMDAGDCTAEEVQKNVDKAIAEAQIEMNTNITKIQKESTASENKSGEISSDHHLDVFFGNIKSSMEKQLNEVKTTVKGKSKIDKIILEEVLKTSQAKLKTEIDSHYDAVKQVTSVDHITGTQQQVDSQIENNRHGLYKDTIEKVAVGTAAVAAAAAAAIGFHKKNQKSEATSVEVINESSIQTVRVKVDTWFSTLTERVTSRTKQGGQNVSADISEIVKSAQNELEVIINELKTEHKDETYVASDSRRSFSCTLEWIKTTAITQSTQITEIVSHSSSSSIDLATQIENHISVTKQQIYGAFEVHKQTESSVAVTSSEDVKLTKEDANASTSIDVVSKDQKHENVVQIVTETREQTQKRISLETTVIVQERKTEITNWLVLLMESLTTIIHSNSDSIRRDIFTRLELAEKEVETYVQDTKQRFLSLTSSSANSKVDAETQKLAVNSIKQSLDCIENIKATLIIQISVIREIITRIEVEDITVITERLHAVIDRAQQRVHHTLDSGIELAITSAFEGKVVTWTEAATIPQSFKNVRVIAYDLAGSVVDYRKSLYKVWKRIITPKNDIVLSTMDFNAFVRDWFGAYTEVKQENYRNRRVVSDDVCLHEALIHILKRFYVKDSFNEAEIKELCDNWRKVGTYDDASIGIRRIKSQTAAKYATIAISDSFSTRTMIELARSNCLCWHAQFSYDMFAGEASTASESLVKGTIGLLDLAHANELAIVSTNQQLISAAKKNGCHAVLIEREEQVQQQVEYDVKVDGLDVFGESVQSFLEHESMVQVWNDKDVPSAPTVWAQKIKGIFN